MRSRGGRTTRKVVLTALLGLLTTGCGGSPLEQNEEVTTRAPGRPVLVAGMKSIGRFVTPFALGAAAWDGNRLWLLGPERNLISVDGTSGAKVTDQTLDLDISSVAGFVVERNRLVTVGQIDPRTPVQLVEVNTDTGKSVRQPTSQGRPLGQIGVVDGVLVAADYELGVVSVDLKSGEVRPLVDPGFTVGLARRVDKDSFWVVDDNRNLLVHISREGKRIAQIQGPQYIGALEVDAAGNAWVAQQSIVQVFDKAGKVIRKFDNFINAFGLFRCGDSIVASDVETGQVAWLRVGDDAQEIRLETGTPGSVVSCAGDDVWFATVDGDYARLNQPKVTQLQKS